MVTVQRCQSARPATVQLLVERGPTGLLTRAGAKGHSLWHLMIQSVANEDFTTMLLKDTERSAEVLMADRTETARVLVAAGLKVPVEGAFGSSPLYDAAMVSYT